MSERASGVLFVRKEYGDLLFYIGYKKLKTMTINESYHLSKRNACINTLREAQYFTTPYAYSGYYRMNICKHDLQKTAFVFLSGTFQCITIPFGLTSERDCFQRALGLIFKLFKYKTCLVYQDEVNTFFNTLGEHIRQIDEIITTITDDDVTLKINNSHLFQRNV